MSSGSDAHGTSPKLAGLGWLIIATALALGFGACDKKQAPSPPSKEESSGSTKTASGSPATAGDAKASWSAFEQADRVIAETDSIPLDNPAGEAKLRTKLHEGLLLLARAVKAEPGNGVARERFGWELMESREFLAHFAQKIDRAMPLAADAKFAGLRIDADSGCIVAFAKEDAAVTPVLRVYQPSTGKLLATLELSPSKAEVTPVNSKPARPPGESSPPPVASDPPPAAPLPSATPASATPDYGAEFAEIVVVHEAAGRVATVQPDGRAELWSFAARHPIAELPAPGHVASISFRADGSELVTADATGTAVIWDAKDGHKLHTLAAGGALTFATYSRDGKQLATCKDDGHVMIWDVSTEKSGQTISFPLPIIYAAFQPDGARLFAAAQGGEKEKCGAFFFNVQTGRTHWEARNTWFQDISFAMPEGLMATTPTAQSPGDTKTAKDATNVNVSIWNMTTGKVVRSLAHKDAVYSVWFSPDGTRLVTVCGDRGIRLWDAATGRLVGSVWPQGEGQVAQVYFSIDGSRLVALCAGNQVKMWDASEGRALAKSTAASQEYATIASAVTGKRMADDGSVQALSADEEKELLVTLAQLAAKSTPEGRLAKWLLDSSVDPAEGPGQPKAEGK